jgi:hypothetical protein
VDVYHGARDGYYDDCGDHCCSCAAAAVAP